MRFSLLPPSFLATVVPLFLWISVLALPAMSQSLTNQHYELIEYQGIDVARLSELDRFLEKALIPALNRMGIESVGALASETPVEGKVSLFCSSRFAI